MKELGIFFLYHGDIESGINAIHSAAIRAHAPDCELIPLSFKTTSVASEQARASERENIDVLVWSYCQNQELTCKRYLVVESDTLVTQHPREFFGGHWDKDVVGSVIVNPNSLKQIIPNYIYPTEWFWFWKGIENEYQTHHTIMRGMIPVFGLFSQRAIKDMTDTYFSTPWINKCFCECRLGTLASLAGYEPVSFDSNTAHTKVWAGPYPVVVKGPGIWHPVKT